MAIRYDKKLNQEINRTIKNFNQKVTRLEKQQRELLPAKVTKKQVTENIYTRADLKRKLKELQRFSERGAEEVVTTKGGVKLTKYELQKVKKENARLKANISREIKRLSTKKPKIFGKEQQTTFAEMGDQDYLNLVARRVALDKDVNRLTKEEFERLTKLITKTRNAQQYMDYVFKENYADMLTDLGYYFNYDKEKLNMLKDKLMDLKPNDFMKIFREDKSIRAILDYYPIVTESFKPKGNKTKNIPTINPDDIKEDVISLYDNLIDNIDEIIQEYA